MGEGGVGRRRWRGWRGLKGERKEPHPIPIHSLIPSPHSPKPGICEVPSTTQHTHDKHLRANKNSHTGTACAQARHPPTHTKSTHTYQRSYTRDAGMHTHTHTAVVTIPHDPAASFQT